MSFPKIQVLGDRALVLSAPSPVTLANQARIWAVAERAHEWNDVIDVVPGMNNVTIVFDPLTADTPALGRQLEQAWAATARSTQTPGRLIDIPVHYGGDAGPDLGLVAAHTGLTPQQLVERHAAASYTVYFLGFQPGFAYLGGLDSVLHTPRRAEPRLRVPAGSVGIGGAQTGIYPAATPGGWNIIGRSDLALFDPAKTPASTLQPGDQVRFIVESMTA